MENSNEKGDKITKVLAASGHGSRRSCEELIDMLRVTINGRVAERGDRVLPGDEVRLDNTKVRKPIMAYFKLYKPKGFLCNATPKKTGNHIDELIPRIKQRLFPVGRLDKDFEGLILLTNDGELCNRLTHPRYQCPKRYEVKVQGMITKEAMEKISKGIFLSEGKTAPIDISIKRKSKERSILIMEIRENRRRLIPRLFAHLEYNVEKIKRVSVGPVQLQGLEIGEAKRLTTTEIEKLTKAAFSAKVNVVHKKKISRFNPNATVRKKTSTKKSTKSTSKASTGRSTSRGAKSSTKKSTKKRKR